MSSEIVHLEYLSDFDIAPVPDGFTRFVCISDTHGRTFHVPGGPDDILLHAGDLTDTGTLSNFITTIDWLSALPHRYKIIIAGNHDLTLHDSWYASKFDRFHHKGPEDVEKIKDLLVNSKAKQSGIVYLQDDQFSFLSQDKTKTWTIYGSPWSPWFYDWAFNYERSSGADLIAKFPKTDILITHGPPATIFDKTTDGTDAGCRDLANRLPMLRPRLSLFGHIHEDRGAAIHSWGADASKFPFFHSPGMTSVRDVLRTPNNMVIHKEVDEHEHTVFVNAANWPAGPAAHMPFKTHFGGARFRPIIVDLNNNVIDGKIPEETPPTGMFNFLRGCSIKIHPVK